MRSTIILASFGPSGTWGQMGSDEDPESVRRAYRAVFFRSRP